MVPLENTATVLLADYRNAPVRYILDTAAGLVTEARAVDPAAAEAGALQRGVVGFGAWQKLHFRQRRRVFMAVYSTGEQLVLRIGTFEVRWPDPELRVRRSAVFAHVKRFRVYRADQLILSFLYPFLDWDAFPDNGDILTYAESMTRTPNVTMRTILRFKVISTGIDPMSERYVEEVAAALHEADRRTGKEP
ncbi:hypothetical protein [Anaeromyxobacter dehalogenans]|uniref:Uncharacterized protein n=1 Tax=Anaeromyxobacter dehalogenans (strain 2CP-C) TaxID=290397 RepID=Q2IN58_ANADE|nr:hypothetical protein [Anaeromyxobacter dehalogenans]ABC80236.1 hypothetical protein Adeh_0460 [Anaeromyxobacter dehalogenans 2CP-C]